METAFHPNGMSFTSHNPQTSRNSEIHVQHDVTHAGQAGLICYSPRMMSSIRRRGDCRNQLIDLRDGLPLPMLMIVVVTRVGYRSGTIVFRHRHRATARLVLQRSLPHVMPGRRIYLLR